MQLPSHVTNYSVFKDGRRLIGLADVTLPNLQNLADTLKGSGIFGEIDMPVQAHFQSMTTTLKWNTIIDDVLFATIQDGATLDMWSAVQLHDSGTNKIIHKGWRFVMGTVPKSLNFGKLEVGTKGELETEYEVVSLRVLSDDRVLMEINKENAISRSWNGFSLDDSGQRIRQLIGL